MTSQGDVQFIVKKLNETLVGGRIKAIIYDDENESYGLQVQTVDGRTLDCWIDCDPEGNGPGFVSIEED